MRPADIALTFVESCCYTAEGLWMPAKELWCAYKEWSEESNLRLLRRKDLLSRLGVYFDVVKGRPTKITSLLLKDPDEWEWYDPGDLRKIYLISDGRRTKIGISIDPPTRMAFLQVGASDELTLLHSWPGTYEMETEIQDRYAHKHWRGEWYNLSEEDIRVISRLAQCLGYQTC